MHPGQALTGFFLPDDWVLWQGGRSLEATKLSTGERVRIEGAVADDVPIDELSPSVWDSLARFEPLLGQLRAQLRRRELQPLTRGTVLRGSGWKQLFVELTARCNERCIHCYAESSPERSESLTWAELREVLEDARALGFERVQLTGGDPLVSVHCIPAVELASALGIPEVEIYTNGLALRGETYARLRRLAPSFAFSFYSHDPATHDTITRTPGSHVRTTRAIRRALDDGLRVRVGVISMPENRGHASETQALLLDLGVRADAIGFDSVRGVGRGAAGSGYTGGLQENPSKGGTESTRPRNFGGSAAVSYDATVYPCIFSRHLRLGSIRNGERLAEILSSTEPVASPKNSLLSSHQRWSDKLACWECQARAVLLEGIRRA